MMDTTNTATIQLLSPSILSDHPEISKTVAYLRKGLLKEIGWHYWVDITWILNRLQKLQVAPGSTIIDAGAGNGLLQFLLAHYGYNVISVDFVPRKLPLLHRLAYPFGVVENKADFDHSYISHVAEVKRSKYNPKRLLSFVRKNWSGIFGYLGLLTTTKLSKSKPGKIMLYRADIKSMGEIQSASVDALVSCSVIEHLNSDDLPSAVSEFSRVLKPGGPMLITTSAAREKDWFHEPSLGWCFSKETLVKTFNGFADSKSGFDNYDLVLNQYRESELLKNSLASSYYASGNNGMPWGKWEPQYLPVGITKINH